MSTFRDETKFLREWIEYHRLVGVERFFLLCNDDPEERAKVAAILQPYEKKGIVAWKPFETRTPTWQLEAWKMLLDTWAKKTRWAAMIDVDEFLFPIKEDTIWPTLSQAEKDHRIAGLAVYCSIFGAAGLTASPTLQTQELLRRAPLAHETSWTAKYILRVDRLEKTSVKGYRMPLPGHRLVDTSGNDVTHAKKRPGPLDVLRLNHYSVRSVEDWDRKLRRGWPESAIQWTDPNRKHTDHKLAMLDRNEEKDTTMRRFGPALQAALAS